MILQFERENICEFYHLSGGGLGVTNYSHNYKINLIKMPTENFLSKTLRLECERK